MIFCGSHIRGRELFLKNLRKPELQKSLKGYIRAGLDNQPMEERQD
jgi:hypothetical protein